ncbi:MAG: CRISPR-associated endonuclease Cas3'' [Dactylosporangium sp.]|nr:CRISPR-associated endonuclease Cas3'' [Dactylosporangium sp.]NNJ61510.1 CRISPR-associated endonuclease Cas3'' [Dactylosporangium sp.]
MMWAHSANEDGHRQPLDEHLRSTAALAREFAEPFGLGELAYWSGLAHDGGKASRQWQTKLLRVEATGGRVGICHKDYGVQLARQHGLAPLELVLAGHHGGMTCKSSVDDLLGEDEDAEDALRSGPWAEAEGALRPVLPEIFSRVPTLPERFAGEDRLTQEFLLRFLFSCLVDADALDTQAHRLGLAGPRRGSDLDAPRLLDRFLRRRRRYLETRPPSPMDEVRERVFDAAMAAAVTGHPIMRITAPTGAAKTIATAGFALRHAVAFGKRRIIVAVPFITITEQNAAVYRRLLDDADEHADPVVLEQHSHVDVDIDGPGSDRRRQRLVAENWDAPFVVTTTVQLFESLFGRKPARMRKLHRLANSVIVLDEVQALPHRLLPQIADALRILTQRFGVTVLLSSATQPELGALAPLRDLPIQEVLADPAAVFTETRRVRYQWRTSPKPTLAEVMAEALGHRQVLVVANTVRDARTMFEQARADAGHQDQGGRAFHLSTGMCPAHRRAVLREVTACLDSDTPLCLVSTSLIEAGVDLDFPVVFRAVSPPESQAQAAGRCNRHMRLGTEGGLVVVFDPADGGTPPSYATQIDLARLSFGPGLAEPEDVTVLRTYFAALYRTLGVEDRGRPAATIARHRRRWDFLSVADGPRRANGQGRDRDHAFRMILDDTVPVVVAHGTPAERQVVQDALATLRGPLPDRDAWRRIQPYVTTIRQRSARQALADRLAVPVVGDLLEWCGEYDGGFGLVLQPRGEDYIL